MSFESASPKGEGDLPARGLNAEQALLAQLGALSPLWPLFYGACAAGMVAWGMSRWLQLANPERVGRVVPLRLVKPQPQPEPEPKPSLQTATPAAETPEPPAAAPADSAPAATPAPAKPAPAKPAPSAVKPAEPAKAAGPKAFPAKPAKADLPVQAKAAGSKKSQAKPAAPKRG